MTIHSVLSRAKACGGRLVTAALCLVVAGLPVVTQAQRAPRPRVIEGGSGTPDFVLPTNGFRLFGNADLAGTGMHMTRDFGNGLTNYGPCADGFIVIQGCGDVLVAGFARFTTFEILLTAGTPPSEFRKIRSVYPEIQDNVSGDGYTHLMNFFLFGGRGEIGPADGTLGVLFSGVTSTNDASCRNNTGYLNGYMATGVSLLAGSTCPDTWANGVFDGPRPIPDSAFIRAFNNDPNGYNFDYWKIPATELDQTGFLGDFSTYGRISDHFTEILASYGGVTRLGAGPSSIQGYPLGLVMDFQAFSFGLPQIANAVFWQMTVINNSEALYGTGIDYDSLYMGLSLGWGNDPQANTVYYVPSQNAVKVANVGTSGTGNCNGARVPAGAQPCGTFGFSTGGAVGVIGLKSPIGDMRNKLFTRSGPFFNPANEHAGDTITFNHGHMCGFGSCWDHTINVRDRRGFGMISSTSENVLDGRTPGSLTAAQNYRTFRNFDFPNLTGQFNRYVPGNWDYNHDGSPDTLFFDSCHTQGCVETWSDTLPGGLVNRYSNVGGMMTAGPFSLAAGDTTSFVWAFIGAPDSASFEALVRSTIDAYLSFYLTPKPPPVPEVVSVELEATSISSDGEPFVRLNWTSDPENYSDPFLTKFANDLGASTDPSLARLRNLNPGLQQAILDRAEQNFRALYIFKSCDGGTTFTGDANCVGDEARDSEGAPVKAGWQPYATFTADEATGEITNEFTDANVIGGKTYLYTLVTESRGFSAIVLDSLDTDGDGTVDVLGSRLFTVADTILSSLQRSGPTTARVYVPISLAAGATPANVTFTPVSGAADVMLSARFTQNVIGGKYRMVFGNRFEITTVTDTLTNNLVSTTVKVQDVVDAERASDPGVTLPNFPLSEVTYTADDAVQIVGSTTTLADSLANGTRVITVEVLGLGFVLVSPTSEPLFITTNLTPANTTPSAFQLRSDFPGFILAVDNDEGGEQTLERIVKTSGDTVVVGVMNNNAVQLQEGTSAPSSQTFGLYTIEFVQDAFGSGVPFVIDFSDVGDVRAAIDASLTARQTATTGSTDAGIADLLGVSDLIQVKFPFTITNESANRQTILAMRAADKQSTILIGAGADTLRVQVPDDVWVPGDRFYVLEVVQRDSIANGNVVLDGSDQPIQVTDTLVSFEPMNLGCNSPRLSCNPLAPTTRGSTGYLPYDPQWYLALRYATPFTVASEVELDVQAMQIASTLSSEDLNNVLVVPNPFIFQSQFDEIGNGRRGEARVLFTNVPARGTLRVFSLSGQFLQQLSWTEADLNATGDLPYNLRTREGTDLASGLYIFVITAENGSGGKQYARGKFVVIR